MAGDNAESCIIKLMMIPVRCSLCFTTVPSTSPLASYPYRVQSHCSRPHFIMTLSLLFPPFLSSYIILNFFHKNIFKGFFPLAIEYWRGLDKMNNPLINMWNAVHLQGIIPSYNILGQRIRFYSSAQYL